ncbi:MAG: regulatory protein RecX [Candidatus Omnitrophota bacterium]
MPKTIDQPFSKEKQYCFRLLKIRSRSIKELEERLRQRRVSLEAIKNVVTYLGDLGLLDDVKFAHDWMNWRIANGYGKHRIIAELKQKGILDTIIAETIDETLVGYDEERVARDLAQKRIKRYKDLEKAVLQRRIYGFLLRKGFSQNIALRIVHTYDDK